MKWTLLLIASMLTAAVACNNKERSEETPPPARDTVTDDSHISTTPIPLDGCYRMVLNRDTAIVRLNVVDSFVTGELAYHWFEKDRNDGSVKGVVRDSLLILDYTFRSEGMLSVRQVVFKVSGTSLVEGTGEMTTNDTIRYKNIDALQYQYDHPFIKVSCVQ